MMSRNEYLYIKSRVKKLEGILFEFGLTSDWVVLWKKWLHLSLYEQTQLMDQWNSYYEHCRTGYYGEQFKQVSLLFKSGRYKEALAQITEGKTSSPPSHIKPSSIDPEELQEKLRPFFETKHLIVQLKKELAEYAPVYERSAEVDTTL